MTRDTWDILERLGLADMAGEPAQTLAYGDQRVLEVAIALAGKPKILFLDEPTRGLDPGVARDIRSLISELAQGGMTIFLTTHYMEEAYHLCDEIAIMDAGEIIAEGTPQALLAEHYNDVVLQLPREDFPATDGGLAATVLRGEQVIEILTADVDSTIRRLVELGTPLDRLVIRPRTLEDLFLELTGKQLRA